MFREHVAGCGIRVIDMAGDSMLSLFDTTNRHHDRRPGR
jgi:hypothetical protein